MYGAAIALHSDFKGICWTDDRLDTTNVFFCSCTAEASVLGNTPSDRDILQIERNGPNPTSRQYRFEIRGRQPGVVKMGIYDVQGRLVRTLPAIIEILPDFGVPLRKLIDQFDQLGLGLALQKSADLLFNILAQGGFVTVSPVLPILMLQKTKAFIVLARFGNSPVGCNPFEILKHYGDPMLAVDCVGAGADRVRQAVITHLTLVA